MDDAIAGDARHRTVPSGPAVVHPLAFPAATSEPWRLFRAARSARSAQGWRDLAEALARADRPWGAACAYTRAARRDPIDVHSRHAAAELYRERGTLAAAKDLYEAILAINPHDADACARLGAILAEESMAHAVPAEGYLRRAHHLGAAPREALVPLCRLLANHSRDAEIVALTEGYTDAAVLDQRIHAQAALGTLDDAADTAAAALERNPHNPVAWYNLGALRRPDRAPAVAIEDHGHDPRRALAAKAARAEADTELYEAYAFALANLHEAHDDPDAAWPWYVAGNRSVRARIGTDIAAMEDLEARYEALIGYGRRALPAGHMLDSFPRGGTGAGGLSGAGRAFLGLPGEPVCRHGSIGGGGVPSIQ